MRRRELGQDQVVGEVRCRSDPYQPGHPLGPLTRNQKHDPPAHAGTDQHQRAVGGGVDDGQRIVAPVSDASVLEVTRGRTMAAIVEAEKCLAAPCAVLFQAEGLGARHVGTEASQEQHCRSAAGGRDEGKRRTIIQVEMS